MLSTPLTPPSTVKRKKASKLNKFLKLLKSGCEYCLLCVAGCGFGLTCVAGCGFGLTCVTGCGFGLTRVAGCGFGLTCVAGCGLVLHVSLVVGLVSRVSLVVGLVLHVSLVVGWSCMCVAFCGFGLCMCGPLSGWWLMFGNQSIFMTLVCCTFMECTPYSSMQCVFLPYVNFLSAVSKCTGMQGVSHSIDKQSNST